MYYNYYSEFNQIINQLGYLTTVCIVSVVVNLFVGFSLLKGRK